MNRSCIVIGIVGFILGGCASTYPTHSDFEIGMSQDDVNREFGSPVLVEYIFSDNPTKFISEPITGEPAPQQIEVWSYDSKSGDESQMTGTDGKTGTSLLYFFKNRLTRIDWVTENGSANDT